MGVFSRSNQSKHANANANSPRTSLSSHLTPSRTPAQPLPFSVHRNLTAAASIIDISSPEQRERFKKTRSSNHWQEEAWYYVFSIGEIYYSFTYVANAISRVKLYTGTIEDPTAPPKPTDSDSQVGQAAQEILSRLNSAHGGVPGLLRDLAFNLLAVGEANLVRRPANPFTNPPTPESWDIRSTDELQISSNGNWLILDQEYGDKSSAVEIPKKGSYVARIWIPNPRFSNDAISSMRGVLDSCAELLILNKTFRSTERSRLNSGLLFLPDGLSAAAQGDEDVTNDSTPDTDTSDPFNNPSQVFDAAEASDTDEFEEALLEAMTTPIADEESASAVVPLIVRGPAELGEKIRLIQFERTFDPAHAERATQLLDRILQGLEIPKDVVKGLSGLKFSASHMVDTQLNSNHVEPLALIIADALTTAYLHPHLRAMNFSEDEIRKTVIWFDSFEVTRRPNRAEDADKGYDNYLVSGSSWRKAHQFTDDDAPSTTELAVRLLTEKGDLTPELTEALLTVVSPEIMQAVRNATVAQNPTPFPEAVNEALGTGDGTQPSAPQDDLPPGVELLEPEATPTNEGNTPEEENTPPSDEELQAMLSSADKITNIPDDEVPHQ